MQLGLVTQPIDFTIVHGTVVSFLSLAILCFVANAADACYNGP